MLISHGKPWATLAGHEYDNHSTFDFHYMGARYYDDRIGSFTSVDKASQFASGFNYVGNNPIILTDPDGNFAPFAFAVGAMFGFYNTAKYAEAHDWNAFQSIFGTFAGAVIGGFSANLGASISESTSAILGSAAGSTTNSLGMMALTGEGSPVTNFGFGTLDWGTGKFSTPSKTSEWASGLLTVLEDINKVLPNSPDDGVRWDPETGSFVDVNNNDAEIVSFTAEEIQEMKNRPGAWYAKGKGFISSEGKKHPKGEIGSTYRVHADGPGAPHLDIYSDATVGKLGYKYVAHWDMFGSNPLTNLGTAAHHILFDAGPDMLRRGEVLGLGVIEKVLSPAAYFGRGYYRAYYVQKF